MTAIELLLRPMGRWFIRPFVLLFCVATYAFAAVADFGWLLVMGLAQCRQDEVWLRRSYVAVSFLVLIYSEVPWAVVALWGLVRPAERASLTFGILQGGNPQWSDPALQVQLQLDRFPHLQW